jgi:hypothetical protein
MRVARPQHRGDELADLPIADQQRVEHVLARVAVIGAPFLLPMPRIIGAIAIQGDVRRDTVALPLPQVDLP